MKRLTSDVTVYKGGNGVYYVEFWETDLNSEYDIATYPVSDLDSVKELVNGWGLSIVDLFAFLEYSSSTVEPSNDPIENMVNDLTRFYI